jgi:CheY-like chemotaxis protein
MTSRITEQPRAVLVDDDIHSARLLVRTLSRLGGPTLTWYGRAERSLRLLVDEFAGSRHSRPHVIVVDLKGSSAATAAFVHRLRQHLPAAVPIVAMAADRDRPVHDAILAAGATAVFARGPDAAAYRSEVARLAAFLASRLTRRPHRTIAAEAAAPSFVGLDGDHEPGSPEAGAPASRKFTARVDGPAGQPAAAGPTGFTLPSRYATYGGPAGEPKQFLV